MQERDQQDEATQTTAAGLTQLATTIVELLRARDIDSRFGGKLLKRLEKEAKLVTEHGEVAPGEAEKSALADGLDQLAQALRQSDASLLVQANARLRSDDETASKRRKSKKDDAS